MIRASAGTEVSRFVSYTFLDLMSHFCDTDIFAPCIEAKCEISEAEWNAIPEDLVDKTIAGDLQAFEDVGGMEFVRKKIAQLIKIAKSENEIQMDLVSEVILYLIGMGARSLTWTDDTGLQRWGDDPIIYPYGKELFDAVLADADEFDDPLEYELEVTALFDSLCSLISNNEDPADYVFFDDDFTFLLNDDVADGIYALCRSFGDYDREWHLRPWTDIGEKVPPVVEYAFTEVELDGIDCGSVPEMRETLM